MSSAGDYLYIADNGISRFRRVDSSGIISTWLTVPGNGGRNCDPTYSTGNSCLLLFGATSTPYVLMPINGFNNYSPKVLTRVNPDLTLAAVAGGGTSWVDGTPALNAQIDWSASLPLFSPTGDLYFTEFAVHDVRKVTITASTSTVSRVAGLVNCPASGCVAGNGADFLAPLSTGLNAPTTLAFLPNGTLVISDQNNHTLRAIWPPVP
jgi:hypothetical protein